MRRLLKHPGALLGVVAFGLVALLMTSLVGTTLARGTTTDLVRVTAVFSDAAGLKPGDDVRIAGVRVGRVADTELVGEDAVVTLDVDVAQTPSSTTTVSINYLNLMGQRYVALEGDRRDPGTPLEQGDTIPLERTRPALDLTSLFNAFRPLFDALQPADVNELAENLVQVLQGQGPTITDLLQRTTELTGAITDRDELIGSVLDNMTVVLQTADEHREEIVRLVDDLATLTHGLAEDRDAIAGGIDTVQDLTTLAAGVLDETGDSITTDVARLDDLTRFLAGSTEAMAAVLEGIPTQLGVYLRSLGYGSFLNVYVCTLEFAGGGVGGAVPLGDQHTERCR